MNTYFTICNITQQCFDPLWYYFVIIFIALLFIAIHCLEHYIKLLFSKKYNTLLACMYNQKIKPCEGMV